MKVLVICALLGGSVFLSGLVQLGVFKTDSGKPAPTAVAESVKTAPPKAKFPDDLMPAAQAKAVPQAAPFTAGPGIHKIVILAPTGALHPWQEKLPEEWQAESVEETELVVVVSRQKKRFVQKITYKNNAPPIDRYLFEAEVSVVAAKTGQILDNRLFRNFPRQVRARESWETTIIGHVVEWPLVFQWVSAKSKTGFPEEAEPQTVEKVVE